MLLKSPKPKKRLLIALMLSSFASLPSQAAQYALTDIQINSLISKAIESHPLIGSARAEQIATTEGINAAKLNLLPTPSFSTGFGDDDQRVSTINIRQPLWTAGRLTANINQAIYDDKAAIENIYEQQNDVAKTTIDAWQSYITAVEQQRVYLENLKQLDEFENMMKRRVNQGVSARIELDLVTNRILEEQNDYQAAIEQQKIAAARLEQITGQPIAKGSASTVPPLKRLVDQVKVDSVNFQQLAFNEASFYNPSVIKEYFQVESAKQEVKAQRASSYPTVYAQYEHTFDHEEDDEDGAFLVGLNYEPGAGFSSRALTRASAARVNSLEQNQEAARRVVMEDIQVQYQQFASAKSREQSLVAAVAGAQIVVNSYRRQFIAGRKSWLEVLNAVREHSTYQINLVQTRADILGSFNKLRVDFGLMPWQELAHSRSKVTPFKVSDPIKNWFDTQDLTFYSPDLKPNLGVDSYNEFGSYNDIVAYDDTTLTNVALTDDNTFVGIDLSSAAQAQLEDGAVLQVQIEPRDSLSDVESVIQPVFEEATPDYMQPAYTEQDLEQANGSQTEFFAQPQDVIEVENAPVAFSTVQESSDFDSAKAQKATLDPSDDVEINLINFDIDLIEVDDDYVYLYNNQQSTDPMAYPVNLDSDDTLSLPSQNQVSLDDGLQDDIQDTLKKPLIEPQSEVGANSN